jgi:hypothetical protein
VLLDIGSHRDRLDVLEVTKTATLAPVEELTDRMIISDRGVPVAERDCEELKKSLRRFRSDLSDQSRNLKALRCSERDSYLRPRRRLRLRQAYGETGFAEPGYDHSVASSVALRAMADRPGQPTGNRRC